MYLFCMRYEVYVVEEVEGICYGGGRICKQNKSGENLEATTEYELLQFIKEKVTGGRRIFCIARSDR